MTTQAGSLALVERLLAIASVPRVLDADALNVLSQFDWLGAASSRGAETQERDRGLVLTPHPGELARLTGIPASERAAQIDAAQKLANQSRAVIVVKGGPTVVVAAGQSPWINHTGNPGMATAGSGDVLTGVLGGLLAQGLSSWQAARLGVWIHGMAGDLAASRRGQAGMIATDLLEALPEAVALTATA
jgi:NAD(P)H-hydrate epimerase